MNSTSKAVQIMLELARLADEKKETPFEKEIGLGYRSFSSYIREGLKEIVELQDKYYETRYTLETVTDDLKDNEDTLIRIFGTKEIPQYNDSEIAQIKAAVDEIEKSEI